MGFKTKKQLKHFSKCIIFARCIIPLNAYTAILPHSLFVHTHIYEFPTPDYFLHTHHCLISNCVIKPWLQHSLALAAKQHLGLCCGFIVYLYLLLHLWVAITPAWPAYCLGLIDLCAVHHLEPCARKAIGPPDDEIRAISLSNGCKIS